MFSLNQLTAVTVLTKIARRIIPFTFTRPPQRAFLVPRSKLHGHVHSY